MQTGFEAMRLGSIIYFVPFFFVLNPALIGQGGTAEIALVLSTTILGIVLISCGLQGYAYWIGALDRGALSLPGRILLVIGGIVLALPGNNPVVGLSHMQINMAALAIIVVGLGLCWVSRRRTAIEA
jgi:TRAP-type uncharacterized transport system fused permease subunit